jgi:arylformamidase
MKIRSCPGAIAAVAFALALLPSGASAYTPHLDLNYDIDSPPAPSPVRENYLDLYLPPGSAGDHRPVVVYVHGGGWRTGDKRNQIQDKANLFTGAGYVFASLNYRLSPNPPELGNPDRVMFPDHPHDIGEAIGWLDHHVSAYGGDPNRIILLGHSAGAHLVALLGADPRYVRAYDVDPRQLIGVVPLDTAGLDVAEVADPASSDGARLIYWNAFGTPQENAASNAWTIASPIHWAEPSDPPYLLVTQRDDPQRLAVNRRMAVALGQDPDASVLPVALNHGGINRALGDPNDTSGETPAVMAFIARVLAAAEAPKASITRRPPAVVRTAARTVEVSFAFRSNGFESSFRCRLGDRDFTPCRSPRSYRLGPGTHVFAVRAVSPSGAAGPAATARLTVVRR